MSVPKKHRLVVDVNFNNCESYFITLSAHPCNGEIYRIMQDRQPSMKSITLNPLSSMTLIDSIR